MFVVTPVNQEQDFLSGNKIGVFEDSLFVSTINFEGQHGNHLVFFTYFENNSDQKIEIDPAEFSYSLYKNSKDHNSKNLNYTRKAYDPEIQINAMNQALNEAENDKEALTFLNCLIGATSVAVAVANDDDDDCDNSYDVVDAIGGTISNQLEIEETYELEKTDLLIEREFWKKEVLRKTTLYPGERIGGLFHFPLIPEVGWLKIYLPVGDNKHTYKFQQSLIKN